MPIRHVAIGSHSSHWTMASMTRHPQIQPSTYWPHHLAAIPPSAGWLGVELGHEVLTDIRSYDGVLGDCGDYRPAFARLHWLSRSWHGHQAVFSPKTEGMTTSSFNGEPGYQADLLMPGLRFKSFWPIFTVSKHPWVQVPAGEIGVIISQVGAPLAVGAKSAVYNEALANFSDLRSFREWRAKCSAAGASPRLDPSPSSIDAHCAHAQSCVRNANHPELTKLAAADN